MAYRSKYSTETPLFVTDDFILNLKTHRIEIENAV